MDDPRYIVLGRLSFRFSVVRVLFPSFRESTGAWVDSPMFRQLVGGRPGIKYLGPKQAGEPQRAN